MRMHPEPEYHKIANESSGMSPEPWGMVEEV